MLVSILTFIRWTDAMFCQKIMLLLHGKKKENHWMPASSFFAYPHIMPASTVYVSKAIEVSIHHQQDAGIDHNYDSAMKGEIDIIFSMMLRQVTFPQNIKCVFNSGWAILESLDWFIHSFLRKKWEINFKCFLNMLMGCFLILSSSCFVSSNKKNYTIPESLGNQHVPWCHMFLNSYISILLNANKMFYFLLL